MGEEYEAWKFDKDYNDVANFLGISPTARINAKVRQRLDWMLNHLDIKKIGLTGAKTELQKIRKELGTNVVGGLLVDQLFFNLRLKQEQQKERANFGSIATPDELRKAEKQKQLEAKAKEQLKLVEKQIEDERNKIKEIENNIAQQNGAYATA